MNPYLILGYTRIQLMNMFNIVGDPDTKQSIQEAITILDLARVDSPLGLCGPPDIER